jgi:hypothetical protein
MSRITIGSCPGASAAKRFASTLSKTFAELGIVKESLWTGGRPPRLMDILYYFVFLIPINPAIINAIPKKYTYLPLSIK